MNRSSATPPSARIDGARAREPAGVRRRPARGRRPVRPVPAQPARRLGRVARRARRGPCRSRLVRLAGVDGGALWLGGAGRSGLDALAAVGDATPTATAPPTRARRPRRAAGPGRRDCPGGRAVVAVGRAARRSCSASGAPTAARPTPTASGSPSSPATSSRSRSRAPGCARRSSASASELDRRRRRHDRPDPPGRRRAPGRPAQPGRRAAARDRGRATRSVGRARRSSAARSPAATARRPARSPRSWRPGEPIAYRETAVRGADGGSVRVAGGYSAVARDRPGRRPAAGARATAILRDISAVRALEELREGFVATVSHELRTPLSLIRGYAETLLHLELDAEPSSAPTSSASTR